MNEDSGQLWTHLRPKFSDNPQDQVFPKTKMTTQFSKGAISLAPCTSAPGARSSALGTALQPSPRLGAGVRHGSAIAFGPDVASWLRKHGDRFGAEVDSRTKTLRDAARDGASPFAEKTMRTWEAFASRLGNLSDSGSAKLLTWAKELDGTYPSSDPRRAFQQGVEELEGTARQLEAWALDPSAQASPKHKEQAQKGARVLRTVTHKAQTILEEADPKALNDPNFERHFEIQDEHLSITGSIARGGKKAVAGVLRFMARVNERCFGSHTLKNSSVEIGGFFGLGPYVPLKTPLRLPLYAGGSGFGALYFPSIREARRRDSVVDAIMLDYGLGADSSMAAAGWSKRGKDSGSVNLFFASAHYDNVCYEASLGLPGVNSIALGKDVHRGAYVTIDVSLPIPILGPWLAFWPGFHCSIYSPLFEPLAEKVGVPIARWIAGLSARIASLWTRSPAPKESSETLFLSPRLPRTLVQKSSPEKSIVSNVPVLPPEKKPWWRRFLFR